MREGKSKNANGHMEGTQIIEKSIKMVEDSISVPLMLFLSQSPYKELRNPEDVLNAYRLVTVSIAALLLTNHIALLRRDKNGTQNGV